MKKLILRAVLLSLLSAPAYAAETVGTVTHLSGILTVKHPDGSVKILSVKSELIEGDLLSTEKEAYARIKFIDNAEVVIRPGTQLKITAYAYKEGNPAGDKIALDMVKGGLRAVSGLVGKRNKEAVSYGTPTATIGIRGTHFGALFCQNDCGGVPTQTGKTPDNGLHLDVATGSVVVTPNTLPAPPGLASVPRVSPPPTILNTGQFGLLPPVKDGIQPPLQIVPPSQAVQVRMPSAISQNSPAGGATGKSSDPECVVQ